MKCANRLISDLVELDTVLREISNLLQEKDFPHQLSMLLETQKILSSRISIQHDFLDLIRKQNTFSISEEDHLALEKTILDLSCEITQRIPACQTLLAKKKSQLSALISHHHKHVQGHKKALTQSHSEPWSLDITL
ncbi:MAG: hypothetical protein ACRCVN_06835 [Spirochaetia bacterium]